MLYHSFINSQMPNPYSISLQFFIIIFFILSYWLRGLANPTECSNALLSVDVASKLRTDLDSIKSASLDYGNLVQEIPFAVFHPTSIDDIIALVKLSNNCSTPFNIAPRGRGHSVSGQAMARDGVVVEMSSLSSDQNGIGIRVCWSPNLGYYADVGGEQMWIDVLDATLKHGLAPVSWTDYLYLSVGGTLSNAGISGQSFFYGPQISNVHELDVITGKGELMTCSKHLNSELFFAVLGGLGQFGIIIRARIVLDKAPLRAKWVRMVYSDFSTFTRDQERLISTERVNYVEGSLITNGSPLNNWRSNSFYSPSNQSKIASLLRQKQGQLYAIEVVKYYDHHTVDQEVEQLVEELNYIPGFIFKRDVPLVDFLNRAAAGTSSRDNIINSNSVELEAHPWLNLFIPKSSIMNFNVGVFVDIIRDNNHTSGPILFYPMNRQRWDDRMAAIIPEENIFYTLALLHTSRLTEESKVLAKLNNEIIEFCEKSGINIKQYLPHYKSKEEWMKHFGSKWNTFQQWKTQFDPKIILSPGQRIFTSF